MRITSQIRLLAAALMAAAALTGCSGSGTSEPDMPVTPPSPASAAMRFVATTPEAERASRAGVALETIFTDFGVYTYKINRASVAEDVMIHDDTTPYEVRYVSGDWTYELTSAGHLQFEKFWDEDARQYNFVAYAPFSIGSQPATATHTIAVSKTGVSISGIEGNKTAVNTTDWLVSRYRRDNAATVGDFDLLGADPATAICTYPKVTAEVPLVFHHILSAVEFRAYTTNGTPVIIKSLTINLSEGASLATLADYSEGAWTLSTTDSSADICSLGSLNIKVEGTGKPSSTFLFEALEIPQGLTGKEVDVTITTDDGRTLTGTFPLGDSWLSDNRYTYYLKLTGKNEIILGDIDIDKYRWREGNDLDVEDPVVNW